MSESLLPVLLLAAVVTPILLYVFVQAEHAKRERMDRDTAEQAARRDTQDQKRDRP